MTRIKGIFLVIPWLCLTFQLNAQALLKSSGPIPSELKASMLEKYKQMESLSIDSSFYEPRDVRLSRISFYKSSYFFIDAIKANGDILVNDRYTKLLNDIADHLLQDHPQLRAKMHLYAYRSPFVNAFSTDQGDLFFTLGLLARVKSEAELAMVVSHEMIHFIEQHNLEGFSERIKASRRDGHYGDMNVDESVEKIHGFARELEKEADLDGLKYFTKSDYSSNAVTSVLEMLMYSTMAYDNRIFDWTTLWNSSIAIPTFLLADSVPAFDSSNIEDDKYSTHPNVQKRIAYSKAYLSKNPGKGQLLFKTIAQDSFQLLQKEAREMQTFLFYDERYFAKAFYNAYLHSDGGKDSFWVDFMLRCISESVYLRNDGGFSKDNRDEVAGAMFTSHHLINELSKDQMATTNFMVRFFQFEKNPSELNKVHVEKSLLELILCLKKDWEKLEINNFDTAKITVKRRDDVVPLLRIVFESETYKKHFDQTSDYYKIVKKQAEKEQDVVDLTDQKLLVLNPFYLRFDDAQGVNLELTSSSENEDYLLTTLQDVAQHNNRKLKVLDVRVDENNDASMYDDIAILSQYVNLHLNVYSKNRSNASLADKEVLKRISDKYQSRYLMVTGVISLRGRNPYQLKALAVNILFPQLFLHSLVKGGRKDHKVVVYYAIFDLENGTIIRNQARKLDQMMDNRINISLIYNDIFKHL